MPKFVARFRNSNRPATVDEIDMAMRSFPERRTFTLALDAIGIPSRDVVALFAHRLQPEYFASHPWVDIFYDGYAVKLIRTMPSGGFEPLREKIESLARQIGYASMRDAERGGMTTLPPYMDIGGAATEFHHAERASMSDDADRREWTAWHLLQAAKLYVIAYDLRDKGRELKLPAYTVLPPAFPRRQNATAP